ncbi:hypothetical protein PFICI_06574 [Pestalotiopsis fici W106-1]|uniref:Aspergillopepsin-2 n=1 Tax=Pestalotiopsis fici (strain W106-1 / CGMCC3.15140) TaxID=1229662 RepID=W3X841_PESFW|nr:uncharacterized protein PFICI_06574 [Pestalotiopsis fici W106-1]ETS81572.1 hypothetical protein PFICI_06574 [Pestalotiopsis fici W106-1]
MRLSLTVVNALVAAALAAPSPRPRSTLRARHARRTALRHGEFRDSPASLIYSSGSLDLLDSLLSAPESDSSSAAAASESSKNSTVSHPATSQKASTYVDYNDSWAGSVVTGTGMTGVSGSFVVPEPKIPTNGNQVSAQEHVASVWIGMDGYNCDGGLWQAGVDAGVDASGTFYYAWYEWYPSATVEIDLGGVTAGDTIIINMTSGGDYKTGQIVMENVRTGQTYTNTVSDSVALCSTAIDWIVEDLIVDSSTYGLADFGTVTFSDVQGTSTSGSVTLSGVHMLDIQDSAGTQLTSSSTTDNSVVVTYQS